MSPSALEEEVCIGSGPWQRDWVRRDQQPIVVVRLRFTPAAAARGSGVKVTRAREDAQAAIRESSACSLSPIRPDPKARRSGACSKRGSISPRELYAAVVLDRASGSARAHGVDQRQHGYRGGRGHSAGQRIFEKDDRSMIGLGAYQARKDVCAGSEPAGMDVVSSAAAFFTAMVRAFQDLDCSLLGDQSAGADQAGSIIALDAKLNIDDNALLPPPGAGGAARPG